MQDALRHPHPNKGMHLRPQPPKPREERVNLILVFPNLLCKGSVSLRIKNGGHSLPYVPRTQVLCLLEIDVSESEPRCRSFKVSPSLLTPPVSTYRLYSQLSLWCVEMRVDLVIVEVILSPLRLSVNSDRS